LFDSLSRSFALGVVAPANVDPEWAIEPPGPPDVYALRTALASGADPRALLRALLPSSQEYAALRTELAAVMNEPTGALDQNNLSREARIAALRANMERWRWLPRELPASRVEVRIAQAEAILYRPDSTAATHIAIVGAPGTPTPTFNAEIGAITLNPIWTPPSQIAREELLPRFRRDPSAAMREGYEAIGQQGMPIPAGEVNWSEQPFPYTLRQQPGPNNALGQLRFDLPNRFAVYLHDTPRRSLFAREQRLFSHGCIRIDDPVGLAEGVLADPQWTRATIQAAIDTGETQVVPVSPRLPIYALYLTTSLSVDGRVVYHADVYGRDAPLVAALDAPDVALVATLAPPRRCPV
jgi:murein L,D-transpeptidase YcbB/YkuD